MALISLDYQIYVGVGLLHDVTVSCHLQDCPALFVIIWIHQCIMYVFFIINETYI